MFAKLAQLFSRPPPPAAANPFASQVKRALAGSSSSYFSLPALEDKRVGRLPEFVRAFALFDPGAA